MVSVINYRATSSILMTTGFFIIYSTSCIYNIHSSVLALLAHVSSLTCPLVSRGWACSCGFLSPWALLTVSRVQHCSNIPSARDCSGLISTPELLEWTLQIHSEGSQRTEILPAYIPLWIARLPPREGTTSPHCWGKHKIQYNPRWHWRASKHKLLELAVCHSDSKQDQSEAVSACRNQFQLEKKNALDWNNYLESQLI